MEILRSSSHSHKKLKSEYMRWDISLEKSILHLPDKCIFTYLIYAINIPIHLFVLVKQVMRGRLHHSTIKIEILCENQELINQIQNDQGLSIKNWNYM
jgi:hypothetical protein